MLPSAAVKEITAQVQLDVEPLGQGQLSWLVVHWF